MDSWGQLEDENRKTSGGNLRKLRDVLQFTQPEMAHVLGVSDRHVQAVERGEDTPSGELLHRYEGIAALFGRHLEFHGFQVPSDNAQLAMRYARKHAA